MSSTPHPMHSRRHRGLPGHDPWTAQRARVTSRSGYLLNPLPPARGICHVCRGPANAPYTRCLQCDGHFRAADGRTADVVAPISYAIKGEQHAFNLASYKGRRASEAVRTDLLMLLLIFLADHGRCLLRGTGVRTFDAAAVVPSTRGRPGPHPLQSLVGDRLRLPWLSLAANSRIGAEIRSFHSDRFALTEDQPVDPAGAAVLLLDDTWTTGSRIQAASYALKAAGVRAVAAVLLGRHVNPEWAPWKPIIATARKNGFMLERCAVHVDDAAPARTGGPMASGSGEGITAGF